MKDIRFIRVFTKYDSPPLKIHIPVFNIFGATLDKDGTYRPSTPRSASIDFLPTKTIEGLEGVRFVTYE